MLLKAERIISHDNYLLNESDYDIFQLVRHELAEKITSDMIDKGLVKIDIANEMTDDFGAIVKVRAMVRAYNPDD